MVNDITILLLANLHCMVALIIRIFPEIMDIDYISGKKVTSNHLSEYFCTFKINIVDI